MAFQRYFSSCSSYDCTYVDSVLRSSYKAQARLGGTTEKEVNHGC